VNNFAVIEKLEDFSFEKVQYYSIRFEEKDFNEFFDFLNRMENVPEIEMDLNNLLLWIEEIGENYGAIRHEANTLANRIDRLFHDESIRWNEDYSDILFEPGLIIEL